MSNAKESGRPQLDELLCGLPRDIAPPERLWARVEARLVGRSAAADELLSLLPREIAPPDGLWPRVESTLRQAPARRSAHTPSPWIRLAQAAGFVAFIAVAGLATLRLGTLDGTGAALVYTGPPAPVAVDETDWLELAGDLFDTAPASGSTTRAIFEETRRTFLNEINTVHRERESIEESLARYPDNMALHELWRHAYETELLLIDEAGRVLTFIQRG